ncbi:MAG: S1 RNA-binding domain-containing protein [Chloroflexota bacterium]|nr:S1 RNA-binding domain-containing protein [Chloroflexota bacterium]
MTPKSNDTVLSMDDLQPKTRLEGKVKEVGLHGAVVDVGLAYEGLLHISQLTPDGEVDAVTEAVEIGDEVTVWVTEVHPEERRVSLTMVEPPDVTWDEVREGKLYTGRVTRIEQYGAFVDIGAERPGLLHVREMSSGYVDHPSEMVSVGDEIEVRILRVDHRRQRIDLTRQGLEEEAVQEPEPQEAAEEEEEAAQTVMELAMERARADRQEGAGEAQRSKKRRREDPEREEILQRTLDQHSGEEE